MRRVAAWTVAVWAAAALAGLPATAAERSIEKSIVVPATIDQTWDTWTTREGIISFLAPEAKVEPKVGGAFHVYFNPLAEPGMKGADDMRFMALQPKRMLSFDWNAPPHLSQARQQRTFVVVRFTSVGDKDTQVTLHHTGWGDGDEWDKAYVYFDRNWMNVLTNLKTRFETGPMDWTEWMNTLRKMQPSKH
ncbi:MAG TPA: SRPBCC domain-containing protein [Casimicrobiaceae bacterium]|nr:SRPBCC domain-containing protein [Casimicrobiaceae bacterium]